MILLASSRLMARMAVSFWSQWNGGTVYGPAPRWQAAGSTKAVWGNGPAAQQAAHSLRRLLVARFARGLFGSEAVVHQTDGVKATESGKPVRPRWTGRWEDKRTSRERYHS